MATVARPWLVLPIENLSLETLDLASNQTLRESVVGADEADFQRAHLPPKLCYAWLQAGMSRVKHQATTLH